MSKNPKYIVKSQELPVAQNLEALKEVAIDIAKQLSEDVWTDFNEHDPGVTIIEQFCYAIMEMSYKANFDFEQLFFANEGMTDFKLDQYFLLEKEEVFYTNPVTPLDYRKLLIDYVDNNNELVTFLGEVIRNTWFIPSEEHKAYSIYTHLDKVKIEERIKQTLEKEFNEKNQEELSSVEELEEKLKKESQQEIYRIYHKFRNIGETCKDCLLLKPLSVHEKFVLSKNRINHYTQDKLVELLTTFILEIKNFIELPLQFKNSIADFNFEEDAPEKTELLHGTLPNQKFINPISLSLSDANEVQEKLKLNVFLTNNAHKWGNIIDFNQEETPIDGKILRRVNFNNHEKEILFFDEDAFLITLNPFEETTKNNTLKKEIKERLQVHSVSKINATIEWDSYSPASSLSKADLADYYSIQYTFPSNYNLGQADLNGLAEPLKNQLNNLQAYLLLFESLLVDFLVKLVAFPELLKIEDNIDKNTNKVFDTLSNSFLKSIGQIPGSNSLLDTKEKLKEVYNSYSFTIDQKIKLREYALARYGEVFDIDLIKRAWGELENFQDDWLKRLAELMQHFTKYSQNQHRSYAITKPYSDFPLSRKLSILLNKDYDEKKPTIYLVEECLVPLRNNVHQIYRVAIIIDLQEEQLGEEPKELSNTPKRLDAIKALIRNELPLYLTIHFYFLSFEGTKKGIANLFDEESIDIQYINSFAFKEEYWILRERLAEDANSRYIRNR